jgi:hypothetical protein
MNLQMKVLALQHLTPRHTGPVGYLRSSMRGPRTGAWNEVQPQLRDELPFPEKSSQTASSRPTIPAINQQVHHRP